MNPITYLKNVRAELAHVVWPDTRTAVGHTFLILGIGAVVAVFVGALDFGLTHFVTWLITNY